MHIYSVLYAYQTLYLTFILRSKVLHRANREQNHYFPLAGLQTTLNHFPCGSTSHRPCVHTWDRPPKPFLIDLQGHSVWSHTIYSIRDEFQPIHCDLCQFCCRTSSPWPRTPPIDCGTDSRHFYGCRQCTNTGLLSASLSLYTNLFVFLLLFCLSIY